MRRLIICCDGTWKAAESKTVTNVTYMARAIAPTAPDGKAQIVFHDPGVGTGNVLDKFVGGAFGTGLDANIADAYRFLVYNYEPGDEIFLFGFSRGAYTARSTVGMLRKCGLLRKDFAARVGEACELYRRRGDDVDGPVATEFREKYSWPPFAVDFLGVWDTVGALGIPLLRMRLLPWLNKQFHDTRLSRSVKRAYHAVAIDEKRGPFKPTLWETQAAPDQIVEQVWFAGVHSDVGGGYEDRTLANITFQWMALRAWQAGLGFNHRYLRDELGIDLTQPHLVDESGYKGQLHDSVTGMYHAMPRYVRVIGADSSGCEAVWHTARRRAEERVANYPPENLEAYLKSPAATIAGPDALV